VVDNGSRPPGIEPIRHEFPEVHVVQRPVNPGFEGSNLGIEPALAGGARAILLLNNDASVDGASVAAMLEAPGADPAVGVVGPTVWHEGRCISAGGRDTARHGRTHLRLPEPPARLLEVDYVPGIVALVRGRTE
jgi:GT2 family glycosyltransferase